MLEGGWIIMGAGIGIGMVVLAIVMFVNNGSQGARGLNVGNTFFGSITQTVNQDHVTVATPSPEPVRRDRGVDILAIVSLIIGVVGIAVTGYSIYISLVAIG
ncbi:hypothetical protein [Rhodospirillum sp. A1_3_36]|uniref:hypothetical protein n=1 Tax=Rhodospirillum sp. A1_3_36 TaxID=3391666 RepID=UPI0039A69D35